MKETSSGTPEAAAAEPAAETAPPPPKYEPPAVAWEESFEQMVATTCGFYPLEGGPCAAAATN